MPTNMYIEPTVGTSLNASRLQQNDNFRTLLTNFAGSTPPTSSNLTVDGTSLAVPDGVLYRDTTTGTLFITDSTHKKGSYVGGNFTRWGIGTRVANTISEIYANKNLYEQGEFIGDITAGTLYFRTGVSGANADFTQIGAVTAYTVTNSNVIINGPRLEAAKLYATSNVMIGTTTPSNSLHVVGTGYISGITTLGSNVLVTGSLGVATVAPTSKLHVVGNAYISSNTSIGGEATISGNVTASQNITAYSDIRLKDNIRTIPDALNLVQQLRGVFFDKDGSAGVGVIAQEVEKVLPEVVLDNGTYKSVAYGNIIGVLIEAIKELNNKIEDMKKDL